MTNRISIRARRIAPGLARIASGRDPATSQQARRRLLNDTICVHSGGSWVYALPAGGTTSDAGWAVRAWAAA